MFSTLFYSNSKCCIHIYGFEVTEEICFMSFKSYNTTKVAHFNVPSHEKVDNHKVSYFAGKGLLQVLCY